MKTIEIDISKWNYGKNYDKNRLFDGQKYCIVGYILHHLGVQDDDILNYECAEDLPSSIRKDLPDWLSSPADTHNLYHLNDDPEYSVESKKIFLEKALAKFAIHLKFVE